MRVKNMEMLTNHGNIRGRTHVAQIIDAGLDAVDPYYGVKLLVKLENNKIILDNPEFEMRGDPHAGPAIYDLKDYDRVFVIGAAKGVQRAAVALEEILGDKLTGGHVIGKHGDDILCKKIGVTLAGHPVPDEFGPVGCEKIYEFANNITERDLVFTITGSGVGSLMTWPAEGITAEEVRKFTYMMQIEKGVPTTDLNKVRAHIDRMKGGKVSRMFLPATLVHLSTADLAKQTTPVLRCSYTEMMKRNSFFPTLAEGSTFAEAIEVIKKWDAWDKTPESIRNHLLNGGPHNETVKLDEYEKSGARLFGILPKNGTLYPAVRNKAAELGYKSYMLTEYMQAEAKEAGFVNSLVALNIERMGEMVKPPCVLITSGELLVTVGDQKGIGGRNQEYCLAAALNIAGSERVIFGAVDTDGTDGPGGYIADDAPNCLCGAIVDGFTAAEAKEKGIDIREALKTHGTSSPLWKMGSGIHASQSVSALDLGIILIM